MSASRKFSIFTLYKGTWSDTNISSLQQPGLVTFLAGCQVKNNMIQHPGTARPELSDKDELFQLQDLNYPWRSPLFALQSFIYFSFPLLPSPPLCLLPSLWHTPTACFPIWRSLGDGWMHHVLQLCSTTEASFHKTKGNLAKLGTFLFWNEPMFIQKSWNLFNLILMATRENNGQWLFCCWWCCWWFFFSILHNKVGFWYM